MGAPWRTAGINIAIDRSRPIPITTQIASTLRSAIAEGRLKPGARLPSWLDLAAQLGVSRGTVKTAYDALVDEMLLFSAGAAGTRVALSPASRTAVSRPAIIPLPMQENERGFALLPLPFQPGVPAQDAFPAKLWARLRTRAMRETAIAPVGRRDPRGAPELRAQIAAQIAITRGIRCVPDQIILTSGPRNGLCLTLLALQAAGGRALIEDPGCPVMRKGLNLAGVEAVPVPVGADGMQVDLGIRIAPDAALAIVAPAQQLSGGAALSQERRAALLCWAEDENKWIIEDDNLSELQLDGRAPPAMAADDPSGRVIYVGTFDMTISPALGLGFVVAPLALAARFGEVAGHLNPAPNATTQFALTEFLAEGHFLRHLRYMKTLYRQRRELLQRHLDPAVAIDRFAGLTAIALLPYGTDDVALARRAIAREIAPAPLSLWSAEPTRARPGLILGITNLSERRAPKACAALSSLITESAAEGRRPRAIDSHSAFDDSRAACRAARAC